MGAHNKKSDMEISPSGTRQKRKLHGMFMFADWIDVLLMTLGTIGAVGDGCSTNCLLLFASELINSIGNANATGNNAHNFMKEVEKTCLYFVYLGIAVLVVAFMEGYCWSRTSERQVLRIRYMYLEAILRQEVGFFDSQEATTTEIIESISKDTSLIQEVLSEKVPLFLMHSSMFISGLIFSAYFSWRLSLVAFPLVILLIIPGPYIWKVPPLPLPQIPCRVLNSKFLGTASTWFDQDRLFIHC
ncbi:putative ABC transporter B family member 8 [Carex littledalei]|uniref:Putative ABC transporter B family member 8 n=1 Tax=Carex littledalei TaxID=544730 RepID=A0A833R298_9POAL|nr:putative ABC transporter B family member 8 [Carex littledalei]